MLSQENPTLHRLLAKLTWELLQADDYECLADLTDALKGRCARLRIRWTTEAISEAFRLLETNTQLIPQHNPSGRSSTGDIAERPASAAEARAVLERFGIAPSTLDTRPDPSAHEARVRRQARELDQAAYLNERLASVRTRTAADRIRLHRG